MMIETCSDSSWIHQCSLLGYWRAGASDKLNAVIDRKNTIYLHWRKNEKLNPDHGYQGKWF